jgi:hypothetical protein
MTGVEPELAMTIRMTTISRMSMPADPARMRARPEKRLRCLPPGLPRFEAG